MTAARHTTHRRERLGGVPLPEQKPCSVFSFSLFLSLWLCVATAHAQQNPPKNPNATLIETAPVVEKPVTPERFLPDSLDNNWRALNAAKIIQAEALAKLPTGEVLLEYGLQKMASRVYVNDQVKHTVEIYGTRFHTGAFGLHTFFQLDQARSFNAGRYCVRVLATSTVNEAFFTAVKNGFAEIGTRLPVLPARLPEPARQLAQAHYLYGPKALAQSRSFGFLQDSLSFDGGTEAAIADYANGNGTMNMLLVEFQTPQLATDGLAALQTKIAAAPGQEQRLVKRIGNYVAVANNIQDRAAAESLVGQIKYEMKVYWEGKKYSDIPLEYRPPDRTAFAEAAETASVMLRAIYWIGILLVGSVALGLVSGSGFFYWRRYQRRKLGQDELFSDAGGTVRLNLDDYLLEAEPEKKKLLGKAE